MKAAITLREVPYLSAEDSLNYIGCGAERQFEIVADGIYTVGVVYISKNTATPDGTKCPTYINWIELFSVYRRKGLLRDVLNALYERFGVIYLEGTEKTARYYEHIGCEFLGKDELTELPKYRYQKPKKKEEEYEV